MISRREFCFGATAFAAAIAGVGCRPRVKTLKYPENAEECADLFEFFTDKAFDFEDAKAGLKITGEVKAMDAGTGWVRNFYPKQNDVVKSVELGTSDGQLSSLYIYYELPIEVSLKRLESMLGASKEYENITVGKLSAPPATFTNIMPNSTPSGRMPTGSYGFYPDRPLTPSSLKGSLLIDCDMTESNVKRVNWLRCERWTRSD